MKLNEPYGRVLRCGEQFVNGCSNVYSTAGQVNTTVFFMGCFIIVLIREEQTCCIVIEAVCV